MKTVPLDDAAIIFYDAKRSILKRIASDEELDNQISPRLERRMDNPSYADGLSILKALLIGLEVRNCWKSYPENRQLS
jgi:hypothetical protein